MPMIRWSTAIMLVSVVATGCQGGSAPPTSPSPAYTQLTITGVVRDLIQRPIAGARIEVAEGPSLGVATLTDAQGQFSLAATASGDRVAVTVSKDGYETATMRLRSAGALVLSLRDSVLANLEGRATVVVTADASCTQLPASLRIRSYTAVVSPSTGATMANPAIFVGELNGADFYQGYGKMWMTAARDAVRFSVLSWDPFNWWLEDYPIIERVTPTSYFAVSGTATSAFSSGQSTIATALDGTFAFCTESRPGALPQWAPTCVVPQVECTSTHHQLTVTRR
jgi:hypothetical protein